MITFKDGVTCKGVTREIFEAMLLAEETWGSITVTSLTDGIHPGRPLAGDTQDPHYVGKAVDLRVWTIPRDDRPKAVEALRLALKVRNPKYWLLWEAIDKPNEHVHIQIGHVS